MPLGVYCFLCGRSCLWLLLPAHQIGQGYNLQAFVLDWDAGKRRAGDRLTPR
jgi:hypothetical protein